MPASIDADQPRVEAAIILELPNVDMEVEAANDDDDDVKYEPNTLMHAGVKVSYDYLSATVTRGIPDRKDEEEKGHTSYDDLGASYHWEQLGVYGRFQRYKGFYYEDDETGVLYKRPDLALANIEANADYAFDLEKLKEGRGTWMGMLSLQRLSGKGDTTFTPRGLVKFQASALSVMGGYAWNRTYHEKNVVKVAVLAGPGLQVRHSERATGETKDQVGSNIKVNCQVGVVHNEGDNFYGMNVFMLATTTEMQGDKVQYTSIPIDMYYGRKF